MNTEQLSRNQKEYHRRERGGSVPGSARFQHALGVQHPARRMRALPRSPAEENPWQLATDFRLSSTENSIRVNSWNSWRLKPPRIPRISRKRPRPFGCHWSETQFLAVSPAARLDSHFQVTLGFEGDGK